MLLCLCGYKFVIILVLRDEFSLSIVTKILPRKCRGIILPCNELLVTS